MPLEDQEWDMVRCLVVDHLVATADPYDALKLRFPDEVGHWNVSQKATENADMLVSFAKHAPLSDEKPFSIRLLSELARLPEIQLVKADELAHLKKFIARLQGEKDALDSDDPYAASMLPGSGEIFINRHRTREVLRRLVAPEPNRPEPVVMRVVGDERTGKSHTYWLIHHLSAARNFSLVRVPLDRSSTAEDILRDLSVRVVARKDDKPSQVDDPVKRMRHWAQWLVEQARHSAPESGWWFVFDQCNELDPSSDAVDLIAQLAVAVREMEPGGRRPRLILLGYGDQLADLQLHKKQVALDTVNAVERSELCDFFTRVFRSVERHRRPEAEVDEGHLEKMVEEAVQHVLEDAAEAVAEAAAKGESLSFMDALGTATEEVVHVYSG